MNAVPRRALATAARTTSSSGKLYHLLFKRGPTYAAFVLAGAIVVDTGYSGIANSLWASANHGVGRPPPHPRASVSCTEQRGLLHRWRCAPRGSA